MCHDDKARIKREKLWDSQRRLPDQAHDRPVRHPWVPFVILVACLALVVALEWAK
jgi:hypothetical protein